MKVGGRARGGEKERLVKLFNEPSAKKSESEFFLIGR